MIDLNQYKQLKEAVEAKQREADKAAGAFEQALKQLKVDFDVDNVEDAKLLLARLEEEEKKAGEAFEKKFREFRAEWDHVIHPPE